MTRVFEDIPATPPQPRPPEQPKHQRDLQGALWGAEARLTSYNEDQAKVIMRAINRANTSLANRVPVSTL